MTRGDTDSSEYNKRHTHTQTSTTCIWQAVLSSVCMNW